MRTQLADNNGFAVIEVILALTIFAIGFLAVEQMILFSQQSDMKADMYTSANALAGQTMEYLMSLSYSNTLLTDTNNDGVAGLKADTAATADHKGIKSVLPVQSWVPGQYGQSGNTTSQFTVYWNVADGAAGTPMENTKTIRVLVVPNTSRVSDVYWVQFVKLASG